MKHPGASASDSLAARVRQIVEQAPELTACNLVPGFGERVERFATELATWGSRTNLTAHPDDPDEIAFHIIDSLAPVFVLPELSRFAPGTKVLDLGSGAGFPGLILAAATEAEFTLVEARRKRASFLSAAASQMGLRNVVVESARATVETMETGFDVVTSRAVGEAGFEIASKALRPGGCAILWANAGQQIDFARAHKAGLREHSRRDYALSRKQETVQRTLVVLLKD